MKYLAIVKTNALIALAYKGNLVMSSLMDVFRFVTEYIFWVIVFTVDQRDEMFGHTLQSLLTYYVLMYIVGRMTNMASLGEKVAKDIREGGLSNLLIKPFGCISYYFSEIIGKLFPQTCFSLLLFIPITFYLRNQISLSADLYKWALFIFSLCLGIILSFFINFLLSILSFWVVEVNSLFFMKDITIDLLSGKLFPISIFPLGVFTVLKILPFSSCVYFPISLLTQENTYKTIVIGFLLQIFWVIISFLGVRLLWRRGIKKYEGTGM